MDMKAWMHYILEVNNGAKIETISTINKRFIRCSNSKCNLIFQTNLKENFSDTELLCPECRKNLANYHIIQCSNCQSVVELVATQNGEDSVVLFVRKCSHCTGTLEDEQKLHVFFYPDLMI